MYKVDISPTAYDILNKYVDLCLKDNGIDCALRLLDSYDKAILSLTLRPSRGCGRLKSIPNKYRVIPFWPHLWFVFQVIDQAVKIDYIVDDRQDYEKIIF